MADIRWLGHSCFRIKAKEATIIMDPVDRASGYQMGKQTADIVTVSHDHPSHNNLNAIKPDYRVISGPGEYEMHDVFVTGIRTYHDAEKGQQLGKNTVYLIEVEGMTICHLGDLGHSLNSEESEMIANCDILLAPAGGGTTMDPVQAAEVVAQIQPKVVVPMHYATSQGDKSLGTAEAFVKSLGIDAPAPAEKLVIKSSDLGETMRLVLLIPESEARR